MKFEILGTANTDSPARGMFVKPAPKPLPPIPVLETKWNFRDYLGAFLSRVSSYRNRYRMPPGLYKIGNPNAESDVVVTANYKLSVDHLRKHQEGLDLWVLVLDTKGINVWCAAGKGTFGTAELIARMDQTRLSVIVSHKRLVLPQLGAPGVSAQEVRKKTGFRVYYGPVEAKDLREYLANNRKIKPEARKINFGFFERLVLVPMEIIPAARYLIYFILIIFVVMGIDSSGIIFKNRITYGVPYYLTGMAAVFSGAVITPLLLPLIPFRAFSLKGFFTGALSAGLLFHLTDYFGSLPSVIFLFVFLPAASSLTALQFTGSSTFTNHSGVEKEHKYALPVYGAVIVLSVFLILFNKFEHWKIL